MRALLALALLVICLTASADKMSTAKVRAIMKERLGVRRAVSSSGMRAELQCCCGSDNAVKSESGKVSNAYPSCATGQTAKLRKLPGSCTADDCVNPDASALATLNNQCAGPIWTAHRTARASKKAVDTTTVRQLVANNAAAQQRIIDQMYRDWIANAATTGSLSGKDWHNSPCTFKTISRGTSENPWDEMDSVYTVWSHRYSRYAPLNYHRDPRQSLYLSQARWFTYLDPSSSGYTSVMSCSDDASFKVHAVDTTAGTVTIKIAAGVCTAATITANIAPTEGYVPLDFDLNTTTGQMDHIHPGHPVSGLKTLSQFLAQ